MYRISPVLAFVVFTLLLNSAFAQVDLWHCHKTVTETKKNVSYITISSGTGVLTSTIGCDVLVTATRLFTTKLKPETETAVTIVDAGFITTTTTDYEKTKTHHTTVTDKTTTTVTSSIFTTVIPCNEVLLNAVQRRSPHDKRHKRKCKTATKTKTEHIRKTVVVPAVATSTETIALTLGSLTHTTTSTKTSQRTTTATSTITTAATTYVKTVHAHRTTTITDALSTTEVKTKTTSFLVTVDSSGCPLYEATAAAKAYYYKHLHQF